MKRLALMLILSPLFLFGQTRQSTIADSIKKAGTDLTAIADYINKVPGTNVDRIRVSDSDGFVTMMVRVKVADVRITPINLASPVTIKARTRTLLSPQLLPALPAYRPLMEPDTIDALAPMPIVYIKIAITPVAKAAVVTVPTFPFEPEEPEPLPILDNKQLTISAVRQVRLRAVLVPIFEVKKMEVSEMHLSDEGYDLLEKMEGFSPELYSLKDGGFTIGFGFFVPYGEASKWSKGVTLEEAERIIREKVPAYEDQVKQYINVPLTQTEFDALTMLAYNLGGFAKATSIVNDINGGGDFGKLQRDWMRFVHSKAPNVMKGLMNRRKDELKVRSEMNYQPERKLLIYKNNR